MKNSPINDFQQLMAITAEECAELTQVCMKLMRKYNSLALSAQEDKSIKLLVEEAGDVFCMLELLCEHNVLKWTDIKERAVVKKDKLKIWSNLVK